MLTRRQMLGGGLALPLSGRSRAGAQTPIYLSDMHFHSFFGDSVYHARPLAAALAQGQATLVSWSLVGDVPWFDWKRTFKQTSQPKPGEAMGWFKRELGRIKAHAAEQKLRIALNAADVDLALKGEPHIVLSVEGAAFIDKPGDIQTAFDAGIRHLQLVHYIQSPLGDFQTVAPIHNGLTGLGREVVAECNRLGILVDLAHCSPATVQGALAISKAPMVWSHGSVTRGPKPHPGLIIWRARQLALEDAKAIASAAGVIGLWALASDVGRTIEGYGDRLLQMADWLGEDHVAFGTDINGLGSNAVLSTYADVRRVIEHWQRHKVKDTVIRKLAIGNYARVLKAAMAPRA